MAEIAVAPAAEKKKWPPVEEVTLEFPLRECENCGWSLMDAPAKATEKGFNSERQMVYTDFCPRCGRGYTVWTEPLSAPVPEPGPPMMPMTAENDSTESEETSPLLAERQGPEEAPDKSLPTGKDKPVSESQKVKGKTYYCLTCKGNHRRGSKQWDRHLHRRRV